MARDIDRARYRAVVYGNVVTTIQLLLSLSLFAFLVYKYMKAEKVGAE